MYIHLKIYPSPLSRRCYTAQKPIFKNKNKLSSNFCVIYNTSIKVMYILKDCKRSRPNRTVSSHQKRLSRLHISCKDSIVLNPWFSGRGKFPGRTDIIASKPETLTITKHVWDACLVLSLARIFKKSLIDKLAFFFYLLV